MFIIYEMDIRIFVGGRYYVKGAAHSASNSLSSCQKRYVLNNRVDLIFMRYPISRVYSLLSSHILHFLQLIHNPDSTINSISFESTLTLFILFSYLLS